MINRLGALFLIYFIILPLAVFSPKTDVHAHEKNPLTYSKHRGPLNTSNTFPVALFFLNYRPLRAENLRQGEFQFLFDIDEANTIVVNRSLDGNSEVILDSELTQYRFDFSMGLSRKIELGFATTIYSYHGPFMDGFIESFEDAINQPSGTRKRRKKDAFRIFLTHNNEVLLDLDNSSSGFGDSIFRVKYALLEERGLYAIDVSTRFEIKAPTGAESKGMGSGSVDYGVSLLAHKSFGNIHIQADMSYQFLGDLKLDTEYDPDNVFTAILSTEYSWRRISAILQFISTQSALRNIGIPNLEEGGQAAVLGLKWDVLHDLMFQCSMTENISDVTFSDFSINGGLEYRFGKKAPSKKRSGKRSKHRR